MTVTRANAVAILATLRTGLVRIWLDNIDKPRRKYMNTISQFNSFRALNAVHTGGGVRVPFQMKDLVEQLEDPNNAIVRPPFLVDGNVINVDPNHPMNHSLQVQEDFALPQQEFEPLQDVPVEPPAIIVPGIVQPAQQMPLCPVVLGNSINTNRYSRRSRRPTGAASA